MTNDDLDAAAEHGEPYDVIHDHTGHTALAMADRVSAPLVHTLHGPFTAEASDFSARHGAKASIVAISQAQLDDAPPEMGGGHVVPNPIDCGEWPFHADKDDFLLWIGRMSPDKGPDRAIAAAREAGVRVVLAGPVQPGQEAFFAEQVEPRSPEGSAPEVVEHGHTGFVVGDEHEMAAAVGRLDEIDPGECPASCERRFGVPAVVRQYERVYRAAMPNRAGRDSVRVP